MARCAQVSINLSKSNVVHLYGTVLCGSCVTRILREIQKKGKIFAEGIPVYHVTHYYSKMSFMGPCSLLYGMVPGWTVWVPCACNADPFQSHENAIWPHYGHGS